MSTIGAGIQSVGKLALAGTVAGIGLVGVAAGVAGAALVNLASDAQEMQGKFDVVFANVGGEVTAQLDEFALAAGRSKYELREMAATFGDTLKPGAAQAIAALTAQGIDSHLISGDNRGSVQAVADALGISAAHANVLPADKAAIINALRKDGVVAMVGDGINDAPALAAADVGIAMGSGTDVAMHAAGITLMHGDPRLVADALDISRRTYNTIRQNLFWAFAYNLIGIPLAAAGLLNPMLAGAAMALSSVSVVSNALLLKTWKPKRSENP
jgi:P-type E1-E2 ATPase